MKVEKTSFQFHQNVNVQKFLNHRCDLIISAEEGLVAKYKRHKEE